MQNSKYYRDRGRALMADSWKTYALAYFFYVLISFGINFLLTNLITLTVGSIFGDVAATAASCIPIVISAIIAGPFALSLTILALKMIRRESFEATEVFCGFDNFTTAMVLYFRQGFFIFLWSLLFIIPGIIAIFSYSMTYFVLAENPDMSAKEAMDRSKELMTGNRWKLFKLNCSFIGWGLLSILTFGILLLWVIPYMEAATAAFYDDLKAQAGYGGYTGGGCTGSYTNPDPNAYTQPNPYGYAQPNPQAYTQPNPQYNPPAGEEGYNPVNKF